MIRTALKECKNALLVTKKFAYLKKKVALKKIIDDRENQMYSTPYYELDTL